MTMTARGPTVLAVPRRSFVLVAGIPRAGKSSLLAARAIPGAAVLDSDPLRRWLRARLSEGTPTAGTASWCTWLTGCASRSPCSPRSGRSWCTCPPPACSAGS
jgi:hypothetical protein